MRFLGYRVSLVALISAAACGGSSEPAPPGPAARLITSGDQQTGVVGKALTQLIGVRVVDANGRGVPLIYVTFDVHGGGSVGSQTAATTNDSGFVRTTWTLGTKVADAQTITIRVPDSPAALSATLTAVASADVPSTLRVVSAPTTAQNGVPIAQPLAVALADQYGNDAGGAGIAVTASVAQHVIRGNATATSEANGRATFAGFAIVGKSGEASIALTSNQLTATTPITLSAGPATTIEAASDRSVTGDLSSGGSAIRVRVLDESANPVSGARIAFNFVALSTITNVTSDSDGIAAFAGWTFPNKVGTYAVIASLAGAPDVSFQITARIGTPVKVVPVDIPTSKPVGVDVPISARVVDAAGNAVPNTTVTWTAPTGGAVSSASSTADESGLVQTVVTMPKIAGTARVRITLATGAMQDITITATPGAPVRITASPTIASISVGTSVTVRATLFDAYGNPVPNTPVATTLYTGPPLGTINPASITDASGTATFVYTASIYSGVQYFSVWSSVSVLTEVQVRVTGGTRALLWLYPPQLNTSVPLKISHCGVMAIRPDGSPYSGVAVAFSLAPGQGTILVSGPSPGVTTLNLVTDQNGWASVTWQLPASGTYSMTVSANATLDNNPLVCRATV